MRTVVDMRILIIHMRYSPDLTGTGPLVTQLAEDLAASGESVTVVTSMPHYGQTKVYSDFQKYQWFFHREDFHGVRVWRTPVYVPPNPQMYHRALNYLSFTVLSLLPAFLSGPTDVILCINPPITTGLSAWVVAAFMNKPLVLNIQDVWPDGAVLIGQLKNRWLILASSLLEKFLYRVASQVVVISSGMRRNLIRKGVPSNKIETLHNWADVMRIQPLPKDNWFRRRHGLNGQFVVLFAGNHGYVSALETVVEAACLLRDEPNVLFLFVGEGSVKSRLALLARQLDLKNVRFLSTQPAEDLPELLASADVSLVTLRGSLGELSVPSKTYSIMASARPILAAVPLDSEVATLIVEAKCGIRVAPDDPKSLAEGIRQIIADPEKHKGYGINGRQYVVKHYQRSLLTARYHELLKRVVNT